MALLFSKDVYSKSIDIIEFNFQRSEIPKEEILPYLQLEVGDGYTLAQVKNAEENLKNIFLQKGYEKSTVSHVFEPVVLENGRIKNKIIFKIKEGPATRIHNIVLRRSENDKSVPEFQWLEVQEKVLSILKVKEGSLLDRNLVFQSNSEIESTLVSGEFVGAKVSSVNIYETQRKKEVTGQSDDHWVDLEFLIAMGDKVSFSFRGNQFFSKNELLELIEEQRVVGFSKSYLSDIKTKIEQEYKKFGYAFVKVDFYTFENKEKNERRVSYVIQEGQRVRVDHIYFDGNFVFSSDLLKEKFYEFSSKLVKRGYFVEADIKKSVELISEWIKSQGFLSAKIISVNTVLIPNELKADVLVYLYEGDQTKIRKINIEGATHLSQEEIKEYLAVEEQKPLNLYALSEGIEKLKTEYRERGFLNFKILNEFEETRPIVSYFQKNQWTELTFLLNEGPLFKAKEIEIFGLNQTKEAIAKRELEIISGEVLTEKSLKNSENNLKKLGIFSTVRTKMDDVEGATDLKNLRFIVEESVPGIYGGGIGIRSDLGARAFGEIGYTNLWGENHAWNFSSEANRRFDQYRFLEYQFMLGYLWPWFYIPKLNFRPSITHEKRQFLKLNASSTAMKLSFDRELWSDPNITLLFGYHFERIEQFDAKIDSADGLNDNQTLRLGSFVPAVRVDTRDDVLSPTKGFYSLLSYEWAHPYFGSQNEPYPIGYTIFQFRADQHIPLFFESRMYLSFRTGFARNTIPDSEIPQGTKQATGIPLVKQFALGGTGSLRGFDLQELNKQDFVVRGSLTFVNYRAQIDFPFAGPMTIGPFIDAANLNLDKFSFGGLRYGAGFALRYNTPVGPVNFDVGFKLNKRPEERNSSVFHFSLGLM